MAFSKKPEKLSSLPYTIDQKCSTHGHLLEMATIVFCCYNFPKLQCGKFFKCELLVFQVHEAGKHGVSKPENNEYLEKFEHNNFGKL